LDAIFNIQTGKNIFTLLAAGDTSANKKFRVHLHTRIIAIERRVRCAILFNWECDVCPAVTGMTRATERISAWAWTVDGLLGIFHCPLGVGVNAPVKCFALANVPQKERTGVYFQANVIIRCDPRLVNIISCCTLFTIAAQRYRYFVSKQGQHD